MPAEASAIFINYRREDSGPSAGRLFDRLADHFGRPNVFMDVYAIKPGENWMEAIDQAVANCELVLVLIGPLWTKVGVDGRRRIDDPGDHVRLEIETALKHGVPVIPLLLEGARMPDQKDLPITLAALSHRQALHLRQESYQGDFDRLHAIVEEKLADHRAGPPSRADANGGAGGVPEPEPGRRAVVIGATLTLLAAALAALWLWPTPTGPSPAAPPGPAAGASGPPRSADPAQLADAERAAVAAVGGFWQRHFTAETGLPYTPPTIAGASRTCGDQPNPYVVYYCPSGDFIAWNEDSMRSAFARHGIAWTYLAIAHQWGNSVQLHLGKDIQFERADCFAGAALQGAVNDGELGADDLQKVVELLPVVYGESHPQSTAEFRKGAAGGVAACISQPS